MEDDRDLREEWREERGITREGEASPFDTPSHDFTFENEGSIWLVTPDGPDALQHLRENVSPEAQWWGRALVVEPRYVEELARSLQDAGYSVSDRGRR